MRREERVTVQGPIKEQQPDGMSHRGVFVLVSCLGCLVSGIPGRPPSVQAMVRLVLCFKSWSPVPQYGLDPGCLHSTGCLLILIAVGGASGVGVGRGCSCG